MTGNPLTELTLEQLRTRTSRKWRTYSSDVLPLWIAEMDVDLAPPIVDALTAALAQGDTGYPAGEDYADAYRGFAKRTWGWDVDLAATASMPDVMRGMTALLGLVTAPGDALVITTPVYPPFFAFARNAGRRVVEAPLHPDGRVNLTSLEIAFQNETRDGRRAALLLSNPHNPTGTVHTAAELTAVAGLANQYSVRVISDEIHAPLVLPGATFTPYLTVPGGQTGFSLVSASKGWNLSGIKAALAVAGTTAIDDLTRLPQETRLGASHLGNIAHAAAFRHGSEWLDALLTGLDQNRHLLRELISEQLSEISYRDPEATFLAWLDCSSLLARLQGETPGAFFIREARVALNDGTGFGGSGHGFVRLNYATNPSIIQTAIERLAAAIRRL
ncbi:MalY/PatB family protein [Microbacterium sp. GCS4]|uniref:MalY/PatB family protein n=1 Tax=Microbacterium sp. GCS4 TaxID=1692239 RepID=UPI00067FA4FD|nr:aminotransferase class I/II-fold pyridoxal phosphate-dependent enzyme [Microbacterium sp. GCS4]KNY04833.1 cystathionine beta-lyase [Microbacterium sp. GCS4]